MTIDTGDVVKHTPMGETWIVAYVQDDRLAWCGWPEGEARLSDCTLVEKATDGARDKLLRELAAMRGSGDARQRYAAFRLKQEEWRVPVAPVRSIVLTQEVFPLSIESVHGEAQMYNNFTTVKFKGLVKVGDPFMAPTDLTVRLDSTVPFARQLGAAVRGRKKYKMTLEETEETF